MREKKFDYRAKYESEKLEYIIKGKYTPDFVITFANGHKRYIETKGYFDPTARRKMAAVKEANPEKDIRLLFARDNFINSRKVTKYSNWAIKYNFPWAIKTIPDEWLIAPGLKKEEDCE